MHVFGAEHKMTKLIMTACLLFTANVVSAKDILDYLLNQSSHHSASGMAREQSISLAGFDITHLVKEVV